MHRLFARKSSLPTAAIAAHSGQTLSARRGARLSERLSACLVACVLALAVLCAPLLPCAADSAFAATRKKNRKPAVTNATKAGAAAAGAVAVGGAAMAGVTAESAKDSAEAPLSGPQAEAAAAYARGEYRVAHGLWQQLAEQSDPRAMNNLGVLYDKGQGFSQDPALAAFWFLKSAEGGHAAGMSNLGRLLEQGRGLPRDPVQAAKWFRKAADQGLAEAQYNLAVLYEQGRGLEKSDREAAAWYSRAAAQNQVEAQSRLGQMYREGRGVKHNATRAVLLLYGASMEGNAEAMNALEKMADEPTGKNKSTPAPTKEAVLFGLPLDRTNRVGLREVLAAGKVPPVREDNTFICDVYDVRAAIPGATEMAACYGPGFPQPLGFVKIDYPSQDKQQAERITAMLAERFGPPSAGEGDTATLWNLGKVIVATQYSAATKETGLMYMVPRVYHMTRTIGQTGQAGQAGQAGHISPLGDPQAGAPSAAPAQATQNPAAASAPVAPATAPAPTAPAKAAATPQKSR